MKSMLFGSSIDTNGNHNSDKSKLLKSQKSAFNDYISKSPSVSDLCCLFNQKINVYTNQIYNTYFE